ncbi:MAG: putative diguanylate cyclase DgcQ [Candidatus Erwinia impunctatus]|nr:putative diguanylate cyclase DgcQ [Culicoides impunctatus]
MICDIDHFKSINDHYGHTAGDSVLKSLADMVENLIREKDIAVRWGGEEFLIIIPDSSLKQGILLAERIRKGV